MKHLLLNVMNNNLNSQVSVPTPADILREPAPSLELRNIDEALTDVAQLPLSEQAGALDNLRVSLLHSLEQAKV